ncbi:MAG: hypothetical protein AAGF94_17990 [Pseudomonadota bacterium]
MTNIFNFTSRKNASQKNDFLKDGSDTLIYDRDGRNISFDPLPPQPVVPNRDWSNQELASIYGVKRLLDAAGVPNVLERGLTDEGDPWCVFCTTSGEVFIHLCRVDSLYVLDSPNLKSPLTGTDFADLISQFSDGALSRDSYTAKTSGRLIKLRQNGKVFLHPSIMLAALIWSIYINAEELVFFASGEDQDIDMDAAFADIGTLAAAPITETDMQNAETELADFKKSLSLHDTLRSDDVRDVAMAKDGAGKMGMMYVPNTIAVGLSSIAIAFGILQETLFDTTPEAPQIAAHEVEGRDDATVLADAEEADSPRDRSVQFDFAVVFEAARDGMAHMLDQLEAGAQMALAGERIGPSLTLETALQMPPVSDLLPVIDITSEDAAVEMAYLPEGEAGAENDDESDSIAAVEEDAPEEIIDIAELGSEPSRSAIDGSEDQLITFASLLDIKNQEYEVVSTFEVGGQTFEATFDVSTLSKEATDLLVSTLDNGPTADDNRELTGSELLLPNGDTILLGAVGEDDLGTQFDPFDDDARAFVAFLKDQSGSHLISGPGKLTIVADIGPVAPDVYHAMTWVNDTGHEISAVGLKSDFEAFDLLG